MSKSTNRGGVDISLQVSFTAPVTLGGGDVTFDQPRTLYVGGAGDLDVTLWGTDGTNGGRSVYSAVSEGDFPRLVKTIHDATTTATNIVSEY